MKQILFNPQRFDLPDHVILIPQLWHKNYFENVKKQALGSFRLILSDVILFPDYTVITGFLGYPHLLTVLEFINQVREKEFYFLGTAGSLNPQIDTPTPLQVSEIYSTEILDYFSPEKSFYLKTMDNPNWKKARGVTVDIIQRETPAWLEQQVKLGLDFVEMEIFPLRVYLEKPFHAVVVTSDLLTPTGVTIFPDRQRLEKEFINAYERIVEKIYGK